MVREIEQKAISGVVWSAVERFSLQGIQFVINIIMARLLLPNDYGIIGMLAIFIQVSQVFIDSGFTNALIRKKKCTELDFSTVFFFNIAISFVFYFLLFITAPYIADFYHMPMLTTVTRVVALNLIINAFYAIHKVKLTIDIDFKTQSKISLIALIISGTLGVILAFSGYGVWALICQTLLNAICSTVLYISLLHWFPLPFFSFSVFKSLFSYSSKLMLSSLIHTVYFNLYTLVIGRRFSASDLGCFTRADQFATFPSSNINAIISRVVFPTLSKFQDDDARLVLAYQKYIRLSSFIIFPLMVGLAALAKPLILLLLTDKWSGIIILLQILCFDWMFDHLSGINLNLLYVKGRSDLALRLEIVKKSIATFILFSSIPFGIIGMCIGRVLYSLVATYLNTYYTKSLIGLSLNAQLKDIAVSFLISMFMGCIVFLFISYLDTYIYQLIFGTLLGVIGYISLAILLKESSLNELLFLIKNIKK